MKTIAMYLPQFHRVKENDEWWGEGFTEWTSVANAEPLFGGHFQPRVPLEGYYDLTKKETMEWQVELMHEYGVDGLCFYHYWFKDGRRILEKPAENLLQWTDVDMPFCFAWANETWARSWSKFADKNVWTDKYEATRNNADNGVLLEQKYGEISQWRQHFEYLLPFFEDRRYIKIEGHPVFLIYKSDDIFCLEEMLQCWNDMAIEAGIETLYIIAVNNRQRNRDGVSAELFHEPQKTIREIDAISAEPGQCRIYEYDSIWRRILSRQSETKVYQGGFAGYDDTPRRGSGGTVVTGGTSKKFRDFLTELFAKNYAVGNEIVFLNAWNEWGEGMYLEPDTQNRYAYLEAVSYAKKHYMNYVDSYAPKEVYKDASDEEIYRKIEKTMNRYEGYWKILDAWMSLKESGISIARYVKDAGYRDIAIYGMGMLGKHLLKEFETEHIAIHYIIDSKKDIIHVGLPVYAPNDELPGTDLIIVTPTYDFETIKLKLQKMSMATIMRLDELVMECS